MTRSTPLSSILERDIRSRFREVAGTFPPTERERFEWGNLISLALMGAVRI